MRWQGKQILELLVVGAAFWAIAGCKKDSSFSDILKVPTPDNGAQDLVPCAAQSLLPSAETLTVAASSTGTAFGVVPNDSSCSIAWSLNGNSLSTTEAFVTIQTADLTSGSNVINVTLTNEKGSASRNWVVTKNIAPTCASQTPGSAGTTLNYNQTLNLSATATSANPLTYSWLFNGATAGSLFVNPTSGGNTASATFTPTLAQVGASQTVTLRFSDGYDTGSCSWALDIQDPNGLTITSCQPTTDPTVILSAGGGSSVTFTANALGTGLTYAWYLDGNLISGATNPDIVRTKDQMSVGNHVLEAVVTDGYSNTDSCTWNVKRNAPPVISSASPDPANILKMNYGSSTPFSVSASDANSDSLNYTWKINGNIVGSILPSGSPNTSLAPNLNIAWIGAHTVTVDVSDGYESSTETWDAEINYFSEACNNVFNSAISPNPKICTLAGIPGVGDQLTPNDDQSKIRIQPMHLIDDGSGNWYISDNVSHVVYFYNRSGSDIANRHGLTIPAGKLRAVIGNGANGRSGEALSNTLFKLNSPRGLAYDSGTGNLYIADTANHRVVRLDSMGIATTVFGTGTTTQNGTTNANGVDGTNLVCGSPWGLALTNDGLGHKWLYMACYDSHSIKRMNADSSSLDFGKGYTVAGWLNSSNSTINNSYGGGSLSVTSVDDSGLTNGETRTINPIDLVADPDGNIFWLENAGVVRAAATSGSPMTFFPNGSVNAAANITVYATDLTSNLTQGTDTFRSYYNTPAATDNVVVSGPIRVLPNTCVPYVASARNAAGQSLPANVNKSFTISANNGGVIYSDSGCTNATGSFTLAADSASIVFWMRDPTAGATTVTANNTTDSKSGNLAVTVQTAASPATKLVVDMAGQILYNDCIPVTVSTQNGGNNLATPSTNRTVGLGASAAGTFFSDATCTTPAATVTLTTSDVQASFYFSPKVVIPPFWSGSITGNSDCNSTGDYAAYGAGIPEAAGTCVLNGSRGLGLWQDGGVTQGFFISHWTNDRISFLNLSGNDHTFGGIAVPAYKSRVILNTAAQQGYSGEDSAYTTRAYDIYGVTVAPDNNTLYFSDHNNYRLRSIDLSAPAGMTATVLGQGYSRSNVNLSTDVAAPLYAFNHPTRLAMDDSTRTLYISDSLNSRLRKVNLLTGLASNVLGNTLGDGNVEDLPPDLARARYPRGLTLWNNGTDKFLVYSDMQNWITTNLAPGSDATDQNCLVRALNLSSSTAGDLFGISINPNRVNTVVGRFTLGCGTWNGPGTTPGSGAVANSLDVRLGNSDALAFDAYGRLFIASTKDSCILVVSPNGSTTVSIGNCGTTPGSSADNYAASATVRQPLGIAVDPVFPGDAATPGNFFFIDSANLAVAKVRYVNFTTSPVTIAGTTVSPATSASNPYIKTLWSSGALATPIPTNQGWITGVTAFDRQVCFGGGRPGDGHSGINNVYCYDRYGVGSFSLRIGPNEATDSTRAGGPLGVEQENVNVNSQTVRLFTPYDLAFDGSGNLYIADRYNHILRFVRRWW